MVAARYTYSAGVTGAQTCLLVYFSSPAYE